jgi:hypothetical protein
VKWGVLAIALTLFVLLPVAGFMVARQAVGRRRVICGLGALGLFAAAIPAFLRGEALGFFNGFEETMLGVSCVTLGHLLLAGLADGWVAMRPGWRMRPVLIQRAVSVSLVLGAYATVFLWPWVD